MLGPERADRNHEKPAVSYLKVWKICKMHLVKSGRDL